MPEKTPGFGAEPHYKWNKSPLRHINDCRLNKNRICPIYAEPKQYCHKYQLVKDFNGALKPVLSQHLQKISEQFGVAKNSDILGLLHVHPDASTLDYDALIVQPRKLVIVLNDGRTWASVNRDRLRKRFIDPLKETTIFLVHPSSPMINVLARKGSIEPSSLIQRIIETLKLIDEISVDSTKVELLGHFLFNPHSIILNEERAVIVPYFISRGGRTVPAFCYDRIENDESYYHKINNDLELLRMDSQGLHLSEIENATDIRPLKERKVVNLKEK